MFKFLLPTLLVKKIFQLQYNTIYYRFSLKGFNPIRKFNLCFRVYNSNPYSVGIILDEEILMFFDSIKGLLGWAAEYNYCDCD